MVFDVESIGLHGEGFAVAWVVLLDGKRVEEGWAYCDPDKAIGTEEGRKWVMENVVGCPGLDAPLQEAPPAEILDDPAEVANHFWRVWRHQHAQGAELWADCGWPVEARFLTRAVDFLRPGKCTVRKGITSIAKSPRDWEGPYPLLDVTTMLRAAGIHPDQGRLVDEKPAHHPLADARQSARMLLECLEQLGIEP